MSCANWDWSKFKGSPTQLKWNRRDLEHLELAISLTPRRRAAIQAGGNVGIFPKRLAESFEAVYTWEPSAHCFPLLVENAPESNICRFQAALGANPALVSLNPNRWDGRIADHEGVGHVNGPGPIPTMRVDDLGIAADLIYLDVEGWEFHALRGAEQTIMVHRPVIVVEVNKSTTYAGVEPETIRAFIIGLEYRHVRTLRSDEFFLPSELADAHV